MKILFLICLMLVMLESKSQSIYVNTYPPSQLQRIGSFDWFRNQTQDAINNVDKSSYDNLYDFAFYFMKYRTALSLISSDEELDKLTFNWVKPHIKKKIASLNIIQKIKLSNCLKGAIEYLQNFDYSKEQKYLSANVGMFAYQSPKDYFDLDFKRSYPAEISSQYRNFEAFLFRRIREGINREMILQFMREVYTYFDFKYAGFISENDEDGVTYKFNCMQNQFDGAYNEYHPVENSWIADSWLKISGNYKKGERVGLWKFYNLINGNRVIDHEIEYLNGKPNKLIKHYYENVTAVFGDKVFHIILKLDVPGKILEASGYSENKFMFSYNSVYDDIDYWDLYDTKQRIVRNLNMPNLRIETDKEIALTDKPNVTRNAESNNYTLYDILNRRNKDHAILIATDTYESYGDNLRNPVKDAEAIGADLKNIYGFDCQLVKNPTKAEFLLSFKKYKNRQFTQDEQLLIFISGHGKYEEDLQEGYLIPRDGKHKFSDFNRETWLSYTELMKNISEIHCNHILLLVDACYSGSLQYSVAKQKDVEDSIGRRMSDPVRWVNGRMPFRTKIYITSSSANRITSDGINHSPFATMFIKGLRAGIDKSPYIATISDIYPYLDRIDPPPIKDYFSDNELEGSFFFIMK